MWKSVFQLNLTSKLDYQPLNLNFKMKDKKTILGDL